MNFKVLLSILVVCSGQLMAMTPEAKADQKAARCLFKEKANVPAFLAKYSPKGLKDLRKAVTKEATDAQNALDSKWMRRSFDAAISILPAYSTLLGLKFLNTTKFLINVYDEIRAEDRPFAVGSAILCGLSGATFTAAGVLGLSYTLPGVFDRFTKEKNTVAKAPELNATINATIKKAQINNNPSQESNIKYLDRLFEPEKTKAAIEEEKAFNIACSKAARINSNISKLI